MKKILVTALSACLLLSSCTTTESGAYTGGTFGTILGSAIGGILGGPRGSDIGTLIGMAGGAAAGAAVGNSTEKRAVKEHYQRVQENKAQGINPYGSSENGYVDNGDNSGFDPNGGGDDRLFDFTPSGENNTLSGENNTQSEAPSVEIRNVRFVDANNDGALSRGEAAELSFEVINRSKYPLDNLQPTVIETSGNRQVAVSSSIRVERIMPGQGIRYTATVKASNRVKNGQAVFVPTVSQSGTTIGQAASVSVPTRR